MGSFADRQLDRVRELATSPSSARRMCRVACDRTLERFRLQWRRIGNRVARRVIASAPDGRAKWAFLDGWTWLFRKAGTDWSNPVIPWVALFAYHSDSVPDRIPVLRRLARLDPASRHVLIHLAAALRHEERHDDAYATLREAQRLLTAELVAADRFDAETSAMLTPVRPSFALIGQPKSGTTSLEYHLVRHPDLLPAIVKEPKTHVWLPDRPELYTTVFPLAPAGSGFTTADFNVCSLLEPEIAASLRALEPELRLVVVHREPGDRCFSEHRMQQDGGSAHPPWPDRVAALLTAWPTAPLRLEDARLVDRAMAPSLLAPFLDAWLDEFPAEKLAVVRFDALISRPATIVAEILEHVRLRPVDLGEFEPMNTNPADAGAAERRATQTLRRWFDDHEQHLWQLVHERGVRVIG